MGSLNRSLCLALDEFYRNINTVAVSAATGSGIDELIDAFQRAKQEFIESYLPDIERYA